MLSPDKVIYVFGIRRQKATRITARQKHKTSCCFLGHPRGTVMLSLYKLIRTYRWTDAGRHGCLLIGEKDMTDDQLNYNHKPLYTSGTATSMRVNIITGLYQQAIS